MPPSNRTGSAATNGDAVAPGSNTRVDSASTDGADTTRFNSGSDSIGRFGAATANGANTNPDSTDEITTAAAPTRRTNDSTGRV